MNGKRHRPEDISSGLLTLKSGLKKTHYGFYYPAFAKRAGSCLSPVKIPFPERFPFVICPGRWHYYFNVSLGAHNGCVL